MTALVACETLLLVLLVLLVAGLLRSHAEILRQLHELPSARGDALTTLPSPGRRAGGEDGHDIVGVTLERDAVKVGLGGDSPPTLLAFLSSGCDVCERFWDDLRTGQAPAELPLEVRFVLITKDSSHESPSRLQRLPSARGALLRLSRGRSGLRRGIGQRVESDRIAAARCDPRRQVRARRRGAGERSGRRPVGRGDRSRPPEPLSARPQRPGRRMIALVGLGCAVGAIAAIRSAWSP
jgi:hypothetical protein